MIEIKWYWKQFQDLTVYELYKLLKLRQDVFVIEQNCVYSDIDGIDDKAWHLLGLIDQDLCACARIIPPTKNGHVSICLLYTSPSPRD